jgi:folate-binding protein YgfZ
VTIREAVRVSGPDAAAYLQGQISQDIESLAAGEVAWSLVLQPTGKLDAWFRIQRVSDETFLLDIDAPLTWPGVVDPTDERQRIRAGMPRMGAELTDETIPGEGGQQLIDLSVSFTKGCYTGQELVARIDSRGGNVPRPVRVLQASGDVNVGDEVTVGDDLVGVVTSAAGDVALAPLMRKVEIGDQVMVGAVTASVVAPAQS